MADYAQDIRDDLSTARDQLDDIQRRCSALLKLLDGIEESAGVLEVELDDALEDDR